MIIPSVARNPYFHERTRDCLLRSESQGKVVGIWASSGSSPSLNPQLENLVQSFEQAKADARRLLTDVSEKRLKQQPEPNSWSALECIGHLNLGNHMMLAEIKQTIAHAPKTTGQTYKMDLLGKLMVWSFKPGRIKLKAP